MSLYRFFAKQSELPNSYGALLASVSPAAIKYANKSVKNVTYERKSKQRRSQLAALVRIWRNSLSIQYFSKTATKQLFGTFLNSWTST